MVFIGVLNILVLMYSIVGSNCDECCDTIKFSPFLRQAHVGALILARGGSKGITLKNLAMIKNQTLLERSVNTLMELKLNNTIQSVWVSTDHYDIAAAAEKAGALVHWRSPYTATDSASSVIAVQEFLQAHGEVTTIALVQCTSPFLRIEFIIRALDYFKCPRVHCVFSVTRSFKLRWKEKDNSMITPLNFDPKHRPRRQDWNGELIENGMLYLSSRNLIAKGRLQDDKCAVVEVPSKFSYEIDTLWDLTLAEKMLELNAEV